MPPKKKQRIAKPPGSSLFNFGFSLVKPAGRPDPFHSLTPEAGPTVPVTAPAPVKSTRERKTTGAKQRVFQVETVEVSDSEFDQTDWEDGPEATLLAGRPDGILEPDGPIPPNAPPLFKPYRPRTTPKVTVGTRMAPSTAIVYSEAEAVAMTRAPNVYPAEWFSSRVTPLDQRAFSAASATLPWSSFRHHARQFRLATVCGRPH